MVDSGLTKARFSVICLAFLCLWPFVNLADRNFSQLDRSDLVFLFILSLVIFFGAITLYLVIGLLVPKLKKPATLVVFGLWVALFFNHYNFVELIKQLGANHPDNYYLFVLMAGTSLIVYLSPRSNFIPLLTLFVVTLCLTPAFSIVYKGYKSSGNEDGSIASREQHVAHGDDKRNVYFIVVDGYSREDQLRKQLLFDNSAFLSSMRNRGFTITKNSLANYPLTFLSISSMLEMKYPLRQGEGYLNRERYYSSIRGNNATVKKFKSMGYRYVQAPSVVWSGSACVGHEDLCLSTTKQMRVGSHELVSTVLRTTPVPGLLKSLSVATAPVKMNLQYLLSAIPGLLDSTHEPLFLFAHVFQPHPPNFYRPDCSYNDEARGEDMREWGEGTRKTYLDELQCANRLMLQLAELLAGKDPSAIVVILSDHGSAFSTDWGIANQDWSHSQFEERFGVFMAIKADPGCQKSIYDSISPVNVFHFVFACLEKRHPSYLEDHSYVINYENKDGDDHPNEAYMFLRKPTAL